MFKKKILSGLLSALMIVSALPGKVAFADNNEKTQRAAYLHAQGENPTETTDVSTVYMGENVDLYFAVDDPNKGDYSAGKHSEPQYDMNGYTVTIYFDPVYFDYASDTKSPIDYTVPDKNLTTSPTGPEETGDGEVDVPTQVGYYPYRKGSGTKVIDGKTYKSANLTVFFSGGYVPQKKAEQLWYNLCKLPLTPLRTGNTQVFFDTMGVEGETLELFAKNKSEDLSDQTFDYTAINGGYHTVVIKDKSRPAAPTATPPAGDYTEKQQITLSAETGCKIYYSTDGVNYEEYTGAPIEMELSGTIYCYAERSSDGQKSNTVRYPYRILPKAPFLFVDRSGAKELIPNIYSEYDAFTVYISDKDSYGPIDPENAVYYTFTDAEETDITEEGFVPAADPSLGWVRVTRNNSFTVTKKTTVRLVTDKIGELSGVAEYYLGVKPAKVVSDHDSGTYDKKIDVVLSCATSGATIYYTLDGGDPLVNGNEYGGAITLAKDTTLRAVAKYDDLYSEISSYYYLFNFYDDFGVDAFYPSGVYTGSVNVTLTANDPSHSIEYRIGDDTEWHPYDESFTFDKDTILSARATDGTKTGDTYTFTYKIKPAPPVFAPESTQFTNADKITVYCIDSVDSVSSQRYDLYYTLDGSDPITGSTARKADDDSDSAVIDITRYTVVKAVVLKDKERYSDVVTHSYDIVTKKPTKPLTTLKPGNYTHKIGDTEGFSTKFMPVSSGTEIYYTVSYDGAYIADPLPNAAGTYLYDDTASPIEVKGRTVIKAVAVNIFGVKSDVGIFEYLVTPEAPKAAPSASVAGTRLPTVPVSTVYGSKVTYNINGYENSFVCDDGVFRLDLQTGAAYKDKECTILLAEGSATPISAPAVLTLKAELDGIESEESHYTYSLGGASTLAQPFADKETGDYEEIKADDDNNLLHVRLDSLNDGAAIRYRLDNTGEWLTYGGEAVRIKKDTILQAYCEKNGARSTTISYVYTFKPLAPIITLPSGRYSKSGNHTTKIEYDDRAPSDKIANDIYYILYRENGDPKDSPYVLGLERDIDHTMSFKAYVKNTETGRVSDNTIHYYIIEPEASAHGTVYMANPYGDATRINADLLGTGEYAKGIKLLTQNHNAAIHYFYSYTMLDSPDSVTSQNLVYNNTPIMVNPSMTSITVTAWLEDENGRIENSDYTHTIEFVHLNVPVTSLEKQYSGKVEFDKGTKYTLINEYAGDEYTILYYTQDGSDPTDPDNKARKKYKGEELTLNEAVTVKAAYFNACGKCTNCKNDDIESCIEVLEGRAIYSKIGTYKYTVTKTGGGGGGGGGSVGGGTKVVDNTRKYTKDIFGNVHPTHIGYINGYPDGSVQPNGSITREEITAILYRITNHDYEQPFVATGDVFPDVGAGRWSLRDIEYMAEKNIVLGYPDGEFKPAGKLTRAEFAALICRFAKLSRVNGENPFPDLEASHWAYKDILSLVASGLVEGYEDGTFRPENEITRAEVMTVINKILGRNPSDPYVRSLDFNPFNDLEKDKWYYVIVLEATITHNYYLNNYGVEIKWEDWK